MPNSNTSHSRNLRNETAKKWHQEQKAKGAKKFIALVKQAHLVNKLEEIKQNQNLSLSDWIEKALTNLDVDGNVIKY